MASAVLKRYEDDGRPESDWPLVEWSARYCIYHTQVALDQILRNFPSPWVGFILRGVVFPLGRRFRTPNDRLGHQVARLLLTPGETRDRLTDALYINRDPDDVTGCLEVAMELAVAADPIEKTLKDNGLRKPYHLDYPDWVAGLVKSGDLSESDGKILIDSAVATRKVIMVDDFPGDFLQAGTGMSGANAGLAAAS